MKLNCGADNGGNKGWTWQAAHEWLQHGSTGHWADSSRLFNVNWAFRLENKKMDFDFKRSNEVQQTIIFTVIIHLNCTKVHCRNYTVCYTTICMIITLKVSFDSQVTQRQLVHVTPCTVCPRIPALLLRSIHVISLVAQTWRQRNKVH